MDQAALQRVTLARPSGTLCGTARGAREQQRLRTWIGCPFSESVASSWPTRWVSGSLFWISCWIPWLRRCNALQVWYWDEDAREAPEQFCRIFSNWAPCNYARLKICLPIAATGWSWHNVLLTLHFATGFVSPSTWYIIHVCPVMNLVSDGCWLVTYLALCDRPSHCHGATPRKGGGTIAS